MKTIKMFLMLLLVLFAFKATNAQGLYTDYFNQKAYWLVGAPWDNSYKVFRLMVAPWGSDTKKDYGFSWEKPFKTITGALNWLPVDLKGYECNILVSGGHYGNGIYPNHRFHNGRVNFMWIGTFANTGSGIWNTWIRAGAVNPITTDSAAYVFDTLQTDCVVQLNCDQDLSSFTWSFRAYDYDNSVAFDNKYIFDGRPGAAHYELFCIRPNTIGTTYLYFTDIGYTLFYLGKTTGYGIELSEWGDMRCAELNKIRIIGGTGTASTGNSIYSTGLWFGGRDLTIASSKIYGVTSMFFTGSSMLSNQNISGLALDSGSAPAVTFYGNYQGVFTYADESATFTDNSTLNHTVRRYHSGALASTTAYLSPNYYLMSNKFGYNNIDTTRTFGAVADSVKIKVILNGQDYWLKLTR
jgi:hypothetical protein